MNPWWAAALSLILYVKETLFLLVTELSDTLLKVYLFGSRKCFVDYAISELDV